MENPSGEFSSSTEPAHTLMLLLSCFSLSYQAILQPSRFYSHCHAICYAHYYFSCLSQPLPFSLDTIQYSFSHGSGALLLGLVPIWPACQKRVDLYNFVKGRHSLSQIHTYGDSSKYVALIFASLGPLLVMLSLVYIMCS